MSVMLNAGAAQNQPKGKAPPTLVIGEHDLISEHVRAASCVNPTADLANRALRPEIKRIAHLCISAPERVVQWRVEAMGYINSLSAKLDPERAKWTAWAPPPP